MSAVVVDSSRHEEYSMEVANASGIKKSRKGGRLMTVVKNRSLIGAVCLAIVLAIASISIVAELKLSVLRVGSTNLISVSPIAPARYKYGGMVVIT